MQSSLRKLSANLTLRAITSALSEMEEDSTKTESAAEQVGLAYADTTDEWMKGVRERESLKTEVNHLKRLNYDLMNANEKLKAENAEYKLLLEAKNKESVARPKTARKKPVNRRQPKKKIPANAAEEKAEAEVFKSTDTLYATIAQQFPDLPLSTVLAAESNFTNADVNNDGTIDADELEKICDAEHMFLTKKDIDDIIKKIDADRNASLDFFECLKVCELLRKHKETGKATGLPNVTETKSSSVCVLQ